MTSNSTLDDREREVEQNRAVLVGTVDALRASVLGEVEEVRRKVSFDYIGTEIRNRVRANPLRSFAIGAGLSFPLWRVGRRIPVPLFLIGAGVALARPSARNALADAASDASDRLGKAGSRSGEALDSVWASAKGTGSQTGQKLAGGLYAAQTIVRTATNDAAARASGMANAGSAAAATFAGKGAAFLQDGSDHLADARDHAGRKVSQTQSRALDLLNENPLLVAGAGLAFGALLAAILPATDTEGQLLDKVAPDLKQKASDLVDKGYETARATAGDVYDAAVGTRRTMD